MPSEISEWMDPIVLDGDEMPWGNVKIKGDEFLICSGLTGRHPDKNQEYPQLLEDPDFETPDQEELDACYHTIEEQTRAIMDKYERIFDEAGTSFENVFYVGHYITERYYWPRAWRAEMEWMKENGYDEFTEKIRPGVLQVVEGLDHADMKIEIRMWATVPE